MYSNPSLANTYMNTHTHTHTHTYINDMQEGLNSYIKLFADDAKLFRVIKSHTDCMELQRDIDKIHVWSKRWKLEFNAKRKLEIQCKEVSCDGNGKE